MTVARIAYETYIRSDAWRNCPARLLELERSGGLCRLCGSGHPEVRIEIHHRTYANFRHERPEDLTALCSACHAFVTDELRRRRVQILVLPVLSDTRRCLPETAIACWGVIDA